MKVIKPTTENQSVRSNDVSVFLAGSIEMGSAEDWQAKLEAKLKETLDHEDIVLFNPRRESWDSSWEQRETNPEFNYQVNWELSSLEMADIIFLNFLPDTKSPISLLELGKFANSGRMIVCCPDGFWRKGNVEIVCSRYNVPFYGSLDEAIGSLVTRIHKTRVSKNSFFLLP